MDITMSNTGQGVRMVSAGVQADLPVTQADDSITLSHLLERIKTLEAFVSKQSAAMALEVKAIKDNVNQVHAEHAEIRDECEKLSEHVGADDEAISEANEYIASVEDMRSEIFNVFCISMANQNAINNLTTDRDRHRTIINHHHAAITRHQANLNRHQADITRNQADVTRHDNEIAEVRDLMYFIDSDPKNID